MNKGNCKQKITTVPGPVESLESYVKADWWREIVNANYLRADGDVVDDESITKAEVDFFLSLLNPGFHDSILDLCCGQGRHSLELAGRGYSQICGLNRSHYLITRARKQARNEGLSNGTPGLLEVNPNPGWCWDGHLAKMAGIAGMSYSGMLAMILKAAEEKISAENGKNL
jgi:SAM-dependent methyltransferase